MLAGSSFALSESYVLIEKNGFVNVYEEPEMDMPAIETDIAVSLLPEADRNNLKEGIHVEGIEELVCILEDLGS